MTYGMTLAFETGAAHFPLARGLDFGATPPPLPLTTATTIPNKEKSARGAVQKTRSPPQGSQIIFLELPLLCTIHTLLNILQSLFRRYGAGFGCGPNPFPPSLYEL